MQIQIRTFGSMIVIVDYDMGNIGSVYNMLKKIGRKSEITRDLEKIRQADHIILPGVGAFDSGMEQLEKFGVVELIRHKALVDKTPILGICLGAQLMLEKSEEGQKVGLGLVQGEVKRFQLSAESKLRIPNMGWNQIEKVKSSKLVDVLPDQPRFYFVHSYHFKMAQPEDQLLMSEYGYSFCSAFQHENISGVQFHPEKSHKFGMALLRNFTEAI
jgi:glutamine amidotransferase